MARTMAEKLKIKPGSDLCLINAPEGYLASLSLGDRETATSLAGQYDWIQLFVKTKSELDALFPAALSALKQGGHLWISYPKGSGKLQTDITRDKGWDAIHSLKWVTLVSVNEVWSAFCFRHPKKGEELNDWRNH